MSKLSALHLILTSVLPAPPTLFSIGAPCFRVPPRTGPRKTGVMGRRETRVDDKPHVVYISKTTLRVRGGEDNFCKAGLYSSPALALKKCVDALKLVDAFKTCYKTCYK